MLADKKPHIVAIGGGTGLSTFLQGLKSFPVEISAIVTVADDGGSSGIIRDEFKIPPPGDIRNVLVSLSNSPEELQKLLQFRFNASDHGEHYLNGHPVGNIMLAAMTEIYAGDFNAAVRTIGEILNVNGHVYPVSHQPGAINARLLDGTTIKGESNIFQAGGKIDAIFYDEEIGVSPGVLEAIADADVIVLGPGSLYTSVIPNIVIPEVAAAINRNRNADVVYICNIMTEAGETDNYTVADHVRALKKHGIKNISKVIINDMPIHKSILDAYCKENAIKVEYIYASNDATWEPVFSRVAQVTNGVVRHNPIKTAASVYAIAVEHI